MSTEVMVTPYDAMVRVRESLTPEQTHLLYLGYYLGKADDRKMYSRPLHHAGRWAAEEAEAVSQEAASAVRSVFEEMGADL